jgi:predicted porin
MFAELRWWLPAVSLCLAISAPPLFADGRDDHSMHFGKRPPNKSTAPDDYLFVTDTQEPEIDPFEALAQQKNGAETDHSSLHGPHDSFNIQADSFTHGQEEGNVRTGDNIIEIYGKAMIALGAHDPGGVSIVSDGSRFGIRGNKTLENNLLTFWQIESSVDLDNLGDGEHGSNESALAGRDSFVGIHDSWGTLVLGKHNTPYKMAVHPWDPFNHLSGDFRAILGHVPGLAADFDHHGNLFHLRAPNSIVYYPNEIGGLNTAFAVAAIDEASENNADYPILSARISYTMARLDLVFAHESHSRIDYSGDPHDPNATAQLIENTHANLFGVMYHLSSTMLTGVIEHIMISDAAINGRERLAGVLGVTHNLSNSSLRATIGMAGTFEQNDGANFFSVGWFRNMSTDTTAYINYAMLQNDSAGNYHTFYAEEGQAKVNSISAGLIHSF